MSEAAVAIQGENSQTMFFGLAMAGGVLGAFLPPLGRMRRLTDNYDEQYHQCRLDVLIWDFT